MGVGPPHVTPAVSVIVPTRDRPAALERLLAALDRQTFGDFEVIVIDDGSRVPCEAHSVGSVMTIRLSGVGAVAARRSGRASAQGRILAFTDDDCVPDEHWLAEGVAAIDGGADVAQGRTIPSRPPTAADRWVEHAADDGLFPTCNVFYRAGAYDAAGGFDTGAARRLGTRGPLGFGEDTLLGWRVARAGRAVACPAAVIVHDVVRASAGELARRAWMARGFPALFREVPELRNRLVFRSRTLGAVRQGGVPLRAIPRLFAVDAVTTAALLWGRVRARRPAGGRE